MIGTSFNYYGYDKSVFVDCIPLIRSTNRKHIFLLNTWFLFVCFFYLVFSAMNLFGVTQERIPLYASYLGISVLFEAVLLFFPRTVERYTTACIYLSVLLMLSHGVLASVASPYMPASLFLVLFALISVSYIGTMGHMLFLSAITCSAFILTSYLFKTFSIAYHDTYNIIIVFILSMGLHYSFQHTKISQFVLYHHDKQMQHELEIQSSFDSLTGLLNRGRFFSIAAKVLRQAQEDCMALCLIDLDGFKAINDGLGHQMGDKAIQMTGRTMLNTLGLQASDAFDPERWDLVEGGSIAGRLGGDEFIVLLRGCSTRQEVIDRMERILAALNAVSFDGLEGIRASVGITVLRPDDADIDGAYKRADDALYKSKRAGKNQIHLCELDCTEVV